MEDPINQEQLLLGAVNTLLLTINELPLENEDDYESYLEARIAKQVILDEKRAVLSEGWDFNTDEKWKFPIDDEGMIPVPTNVLDITAENQDIIMRNWRLYDKRNQTHIFEEPVSCKVIWDMDFNALSHPLRHYITIKSARVFAAKMIGDANSVQFTAIDEDNALIAARRSEGRTGKYNMFKSLYGVNNRVRIS